MKARRTLFITAALLVVITVWCIPKSRPSILFTGVRDTPDGQVAVFLVTNGTASAHSYVSVYRSSVPWDYVYGVPSADNWKTMQRIASGTAELNVLRPHSSFEFVVEPPFEHSGPFAVGVVFFSGSPDEVQHRNTNKFARSLWRLRSAAELYRHSDYTWSQVTKR